MLGRQIWSRVARLCVAGLVTLVVAGCEIIGPDGPGGGLIVQAPPGYGPVPIPAHNQLSIQKVELGEQLFFDPALSRDGTISCASCHLPDRAFSDVTPVSSGVEGRKGRRNSPGLVNVAYAPLLFWDGGSFALENQVVAPLEDPNEMDAELEDVLRTLNADAAYRQRFEEVFGDSVTVRTFTQAIAAFQRTIVGSGAPFDEYIAGDRSALSAAARRGLELFEGRAGCRNCHAGVRFTDDSFRNNGLAFASADSGRARITLRAEDFARFRVPSLRNVGLTAPYMHDGRLASLESVVDHYAAGGSGSRGQDNLIQPIDLTQQERDDLVAFLHALTDVEVRSGVDALGGAGYE